MPRKASGKLNHIKREVAAEAARIMATEGQRNYLAAKQKAAQRLGVTSSLALPSNVAVEDALRAYLDLYGGQERHSHLHYLREEAVKAMRFLARFEPRLVGPVLEGTADGHSRIALHVFSDTPDEVSWYLDEKGIQHREEQRRIRWHDGSFHDLPVVVIDTFEVTVELAVFDRIDQRQSPPSPVNGRPQRRAGISEVMALLAEPQEATLLPASA